MKNLLEIVRDFNLNDNVEVAEPDMVVVLGNGESGIGASNDQIKEEQEKADEEIKEREWKSLLWLWTLIGIIIIIIIIYIIIKLKK